LQTVVTFARLYSRAFGVAAVDRCGRGGVCRSHLLRTRDAGRSWRDITPRAIAAGVEIGDVEFLDARLGWLTAANCAMGRAWIYRTTTGGASWGRLSVEPPTCAGGAQVAPIFVDGPNGWLLRIEPTAPFATLQRSIDGGASWSRAHRVRSLGSVAFADPLRGWLGGGGFGWGRLYASEDGGASWRRTQPPFFAKSGGRRIINDLPTFMDASRGVLPITVVHNHRATVSFDATSDGGRTWRVVAHLAAGGFSQRSYPPYPVSIPIAVASPSTWWMLTGSPVRVHVTSDGGRSWRVFRTWIRRPAAISAVDARVAWIRARVPGQGSLYVTTDGGRSWRLVRFPPLR
jgi:photosystem II stability/assembly factor-like uncharacterized protein